MKTTTSIFGFETINTFTDGDFVVVDRWITSDHSDISSGTTTILFEEVPIWTMSYWGHYPKEVIPFLKEALASQYKIGSFRGGRGAVQWSCPKYTYRNNANPEDGNRDFCRFGGREIIIDSDTMEELGFHAYSGMSML